jgi:hypothetical protein
MFGLLMGLIAHRENIPRILAAPSSGDVHSVARIIRGLVLARCRLGLAALLDVLEGPDRGRIATMRVHQQNKDYAFHGALLASTVY